ncbi:chalcone isomerase family protein [Bacteriovorax sp. Seq25_V]|uniref:chalcone isomerase family protein n=1 Tax=Bacteriovorax sp. Seq25_V TaxID=1201288 RepID=UPI00038A4B1B|nr:chalcone isomerase family protein [Bacteriovorax sp. Seq25_V]EQC46206.1 hypothetical protein M900_1776 [Bacteriovorax sp. Seq25_V]
MVCRTLPFRKIILLFLFSHSILALSLVGKGLLTFTFFRFEVYELELFAKNQVRSLEELQKEESYELVFTFRRDVEAKHLKQAWSDASKEINQASLKPFFSEVEEIQPAMREGEKIRVTKNKDTVTFSFPKSKVELKNAEFAKTLPWIWLGDNEVGEKLAYQIFP